MENGSDPFRRIILEEAALSWLAELGYAIKSGPLIAPGELFSERESYQQVLLRQRLRDALARLNPTLPAEAIEEAFRKIVHLNAPSLLQANRAFHRMLVDGVEVEFQADGRIVHDKAWLVDFQEPDWNDWLAVNQFTVVEGHTERRPDVALFLNGLPVGVIELKNPADENATIWTAFHQLETYKLQISSLFATNEANVISDGLEARFGSLTANREWFLPWRTIEGETLAPSALPQLELLIKGLFERKRFLAFLRSFIVFEQDQGGVAGKKLAGYHQFHAVNVAVEETLRAAAFTKKAGSLREPGVFFTRSPGGAPGDRRVGVVWHTQEPAS